MMANEMRDRLVELMKQINFDFCEECVACTEDGYKTLPMLEDYFADYLIENGVIVPPCKVGDTVYFNKAEIDETCPAKVIGIYHNYFSPSMPLWITIQYESKLVGEQVEKMASDVFKLLCHYSKDQAEQKLKEVRGEEE